MTKNTVFTESSEKSPNKWQHEPYGGEENQSSRVATLDDLKCIFNSNNYNNNKTGSMQRNKKRRLIHKVNNRNYSLGSPDIELIRQIF